MLIREFTNNDQPGVTRLQAEFVQEFFPEFYHDPREYQWNADIYDINKYYLHQGDKFWVVEDEGEIVGVGGIRLVNPTVAEIKRIRIKASYRGNGLGKAIIRIVEDYCRDHKINKILVDTEKRLSTAKAMYEKLGYTIYRTETEIEGTVTFVNYYFEKDLL